MRPASLDKMIALCASLVERSRGTDFRLRLSPKDFNAIAGGKVILKNLESVNYFIKPSNSPSSAKQSNA